MTRKWASMSTSGRLTLDVDLMTLPHDLIDFVFVHELVHLLAPNHGKLHRSFLTAYLPDWERREERLEGYVVPRARQRPRLR
jgi:predicted metal-dependent hydrolase